MTTKPADDLEAVRIIVQTLESFDKVERERIIRWAREKLGMPIPVREEAAGKAQVPSTGQVQMPSEAGVPSATTGQKIGGTDIRSFIKSKNPKSGQQLAAVVAYYYHLVAPEPERKDSIDATDLLDACRKADWPRPGKPAQTMINAHEAGYLDRTGEKGRYRLNSVGENLVAMVLPEGDISEARNKIRRSKKRPAKKRAKATRNRPAARKKKESPTE